MLSQQAMLIIQNPILQNAVEQIFLIWGYRSAVVATLFEAEAVLRQAEPHSLGLVVCATEASGEWDHDTPHRVWDFYACWHTQYPWLPWVFLGPPTHKYALLAGGSTTIPFVTTPFRVAGFLEIVQPLLG